MCETISSPLPFLNVGHLVGLYINTLQSDFQSGGLHQSDQRLSRMSSSMVDLFFYGLGVTIVCGASCQLSLPLIHSQVHLS